MSEIKLLLPASFDEDGDEIYLIDKRHSINDILRFCMRQGNMSKEELKFQIDLMETDADSK